MSSASLLLAKGSKQIEKQKYEHRKEQVTNVKGKISWVSDANVSDINAKIDDCGDKLAAGVSGISGVATLVGEMDGKKESAGTSDSHLSSYEGDLDSEISDCETKISNLETEISSLESQYQTALKDEKEAAKKALESAASFVFD